jgi:hypothetical protein
LRDTERKDIEERKKKIQEQISLSRREREHSLRETIQLIQSSRNHSNSRREAPLYVKYERKGREMEDAE